MKSITSLLALVFVCSVIACGQDTTGHHHGAPAAAPDPMVSQEWAKQRLAKSPRHQEWVKVKHGNREVNSFVVYPENKNKATAVVVIHEIFGVSDFIRQTTEQLAKDGFVAIAHDLLSRTGGTPAAGDSARVLIRALPRAQVMADLDGARAYLRGVRAARADAVGVIGFCWGGGQSFQYATHAPELKAFVVCYGPSAEAADMPKIRARGLGVYAENDARINAGLPDVLAALRAAGKEYQHAVYPGVGHGFLRTREGGAEAAAHAHHFAGGAHFRPEDDVHAAEFVEREHRRLHREVPAANCNFVHAVGIARWYKSTIIVLYVNPAVPFPGSRPGASGVPPVTTGRDRDRLLDALRRFVSRSAPTDPSIAFEVTDGAVVTAILARAASLPGDLIVMGTHARAGFERLALESVTEKVLRKASCPVVSVPRDGPRMTFAVSTTMIPESTDTAKRSRPRGAGPPVFSPTRLYFEPWHGHSSQKFRRHGFGLQPRCGQR